MRKKAATGKQNEMSRTDQRVKTVSTQVTDFLLQNLKKDQLYNEGFIAY